MIYQIHHQPIRSSELSKTNLCFQFEAFCNHGIRAAVEKAWEEFPPPEGYQFLIVCEDSHIFVDVADIFITSNDG